MMLSTHGMMNLSGVMLVHGGAGQASIPVGMEKSGPAPKPGGKSLTWRELELLAQETTPSDQHCRKHVGPAGKSADPAHFFAFSTETNFRSQVSLEEESQNPPSVGHWKPLMPSKGDKEEAESGCQDAGGVHEPQSTEQLNVSRLRSSSVEIREKGSEFLRDELHKAQKELKLKDKECERLSKVREQLEQELEELTASLFEEAHKMVREANTKQAAAEKQLREARGKIDMLQAEVTALKTLVITSTPSSPNRELHPQLQSPSKAGFRKGHGRNKSTSSAMVSAASQSVAPEPVSRECRESGFPALLSLLLCILPGKAIHITYEPGWQALGADASSFSSSSRQLLLVPGRLHFICRVPGLEGISNFGQILLLPGQNLPRRCRTLSGLHQAGAVGAGASGSGAEHPHHRASGFPDCSCGEGGSRRVWWPQEMCSERPPQDLQAPDHAGGFWELLLHFPFLQGQDHSSVQLLHLHPLYPARPGEAGCGADVLGGHAAPEGDVSGQTWILSQRDVSRALSMEETAPGGRAWSAVPVLLPPFPLPGARNKRHKFHLQLSHSSKCDWNAAATLPLELGWPWLLQDGHP
ncbi:guanine nucleotide exchange factor for Rab-3A isoform X2 [Passer montanus]|uniref:guanine nucleotide exchange factor for Rab-3A isoform X2 n=1 Tax=Passer montanus TaxID=9160 RepID=UPI001961F309|nr:guanine nucleotide exchange factor for Rab-3A isoform X2 [Passer montanus]